MNQLSRQFAFLTVLCVLFWGSVALAAGPEDSTGATDDGRKPVNSSAVCQVYDQLLALDILAARLSIDKDHFQVIDAYRSDIQYARQALRKLPANHPAEQTIAVSAHLRAHADAAQTAAYSGSGAAAALLTSEPFIERSLRIESDHKRHGCLRPGWRDRLSFLTGITAPVQRIWSHERLRPFFLWAACFAIVYWARRQQKKQEALSRLNDYQSQNKARHYCSIPAQLFVGAEAQTIRVVDVSKNGARFATARPIALESEMQLHLPQEIHRTCLLLRDQTRHGVVRFLPRLTDVELAQVLAHNELPGGAASRSGIRFTSAKRQEKGRRAEAPALSSI